MRRILAGLTATAMAVLALAVASPALGAGEEISVGADIPRVEPFGARPVACGAQSCLDIRFRVRGDIGPVLVWQMTVTRPDGQVIYEGAGRTRTGRLVRGTLVPSTAPQCGRHRITLTVRDATQLHFDAQASVVRRHRCQRPGRA